MEKASDRYDLLSFGLERMGHKSPLSKEGIGKTESRVLFFSFSRTGLLS
jgi:hypothetical protein